jgi:hypothetical protein
MTEAVDAIPEPLRKAAERYREIVHVGTWITIEEAHELRDLGERMSDLILDGRVDGPPAEQ